jgi:hypothetical protein
MDWACINDIVVFVLQNTSMSYIIILCGHIVSEIVTKVSKIFNCSYLRSALCLIQVRSLCDVLRIRWESTRSRTKQRALLLMENLVSAISFPYTEIPKCCRYTTFIFVEQFFFLQLFIDSAFLLPDCLQFLHTLYHHWYLFS